MPGLTHWHSLDDQTALAVQMYGSTAKRLLNEWLDRAYAQVGNLDFAREFSDHISLPGVSTLDYAHRHVRSQHGDLLGGIRFYNRNIHRPFVEIIAHSFAGRAELMDCVRHEWSMFDVSYLHVRTAPGKITGPGTTPDQSIHVARYRDLAAPDDRVRLVGFDDVEDAVDLVRNRYRELGHCQPPLAHNIAAAADDDIRLWHRDNQLKAIRVDDDIVGLLAIAAGSIGWITGDEINEEVVIAAHCGHGYAASAQSAWASILGRPDQFLCGTIDRHNHSSRRTATKAGRPPVLEDTFIALTE